MTEIIQFPSHRIVREVDHEYEALLKPIEPPRKSWLLWFFFGAALGL
jgi:hypothetical protein